MALLDSFVLLFEADASQLNKSVDEANRKGEKLNDTMKKADGAATMLGGSFVEMLATAGGALAAAFSFGAMMNGIMAANDYADRLGEVSDALGVNIEELDAWGRAVQFSGGSAEAFQATLQNLVADFAMIDTKGTSRTLPFWKELGINVKDAHGKMRDVMDVLPDLAEKFEGLSKGEAMGMGRKLGLDEGTIMLLQRGRREVDEMVKKQKELGVTTKEQAEFAGQYNDAMDEMSLAFRGLFMAVGGSVLPAFKAIAEGITRVVSFFRQHSDFITGLLIAIGAAIAVFVLPSLISMAAATIAAFWPFMLIGAAIAGVIGLFALLYDDIVAFRNGSDSMIGEIAKKWPIVGDVVNGLVDTIKYFVDFTAAAFGLLADLILDPAHAWDNFVGKITGGIETVRGHFPFLFGLIDGLANGFVTMGDVIMGVWDAIVATIMGAIDSVKGAVSDVQEFFGIGGGDVKVAKTAIMSANRSPLNQQSSAAISNSRSVSKSNTVTVGKVEVKTQATDAQGISRAIGGEMKAQLKRATSNYDDGVLA